MTRAQRAVLAVLQPADTFLSAQDIHARLRASGDRVGLTSVYRALQTLADDGVVDVRRNPTGESTYRSCRTDAHHHHLVCRRCGATVEVAAPQIERWVAGLAAAHGFHVETHTVEVTGTCSSCAR